MGQGQVDEEYQCVAKSRLNLKLDSGITKKSKKHKKNKKHRGREPSPSANPPGSSQTQSQSQSVSTNNPPKSQKTPAELAFLKMQEKMVFIML